MKIASMSSSHILLQLVAVLHIAIGMGLSESHQAAFEDCTSLESSHRRGRKNHLDSLPPGSTSSISAPCLWLSSISGRKVLGAQGAHRDSERGAHLIAASQLQMLPPNDRSVVWLFDIQAAKVRWNTHRDRVPGIAPSMRSCA